jgi:hypothetical protein
MSSNFYHVASRFAVLAALLLATPAAATEPASGAGPDGMVIYRDPATGRFADPPPGALPPGVSTLSATPGPVAETAGTSAAGGWKADLRGRFISTMQATADGAGHVGHDCRPGGR